MKATFKCVDISMGVSIATRAKFNESGKILMQGSHQRGMIYDATLQGVFRDDLFSEEPPEFVIGSAPKGFRLQASAPPKEHVVIRTRHPHQFKVGKEYTIEITENES